MLERRGHKRSGRSPGRGRGRGSGGADVSGASGADVGGSTGRVVAVLILQIAMFAYFQVVEWVPLFPWNDLAGANVQGPLDLMVGALQITLIAWTSRGSTPSLRVAAAFYGVWLTLQVVNWWVPYILGADDETREAYARLFARTHKFLPPIADHPIPDSNHVVLQILLSLVLVALFVAMRERPAARPAGPATSRRSSTRYRTPRKPAPPFRP